MEGEPDIKSEGSDELKQSAVNQFPDSITLSVYDQKNQNFKSFLNQYYSQSSKE